MEDRLTLTVELLLAGNHHVIPGGDVLRVELVMATGGAEGMVEFSVKDDRASGGDRSDAVLADLIRDDLGFITLTIVPGMTNRRVATELPPLALKAVIVERSFTEDTGTVGFADPVGLLRTYRVRFADRASVLWSQHRPWSLYTQTTLGDVIDAERGSVEVAYDWERLTADRPMVFLGLGDERGPSFLDFVLWRVTREGGVFAFEPAAGTYTIKGAKSVDGEVSVLWRGEVGPVEHVFAPVARSCPRVVNVDAEIAARAPVGAPRAAAGVFHDVVVRYATAQEADDEFALLANRPPPSKTLALEFVGFPTVAVAPGRLLDLSSKGGFGSGALDGHGPWRVYSLDLVLTSIAAGPDDGDHLPDGRFEVAMRARVEAADDPTPRVAAHRRPEYPGRVEDWVVCEAGAEGEHPYEIKQDEATSADLLRVTIPVFGDQEVNPPFESESLSGTRYLPAPKGARVLLALNFDRCRVERTLAWRDGVRVSTD